MKIKIAVLLLVGLGSVGFAAAEPLGPPPLPWSGAGIHEIRPGVHSVDFVLGRLYLVWTNETWELMTHAPLFTDPAPLTGLEGIGQNTVTLSSQTETEPTSVPEPVTILLLSSGLLGVGLVSRRRRS